MGHRITALVSADAVLAGMADKYDLPCFAQQGFTIVGLDASHNDYWADKLGLSGNNNTVIILDTAVTHFFAYELGLGRYALISTDYFGGSGAQYAGVYERGAVLMPVQAGAINAALRMIGVKRNPSADEFDALDLDKYRQFDDYFDRYYL